MGKVLITGGAGFIGSHTCLALLDKGFELVVLDSYINSSPLSLERVIQLHKENSSGNSSEIQIIDGDLRDFETVNNIFEDAQMSGNPITGVIHFAGLKSVFESLQDPILYWDVNVLGSLNLFKIMESYSCRTIVFSSSATIYGLSSNHLLSEDALLNPINPYGTTKMSVENLLNDMFKSKNWKVINLRYFNPIGAHPSGKIGENPLGRPNNIFPFITNVAKGNISKLQIYGNDWPTNDGTGIRDYIHVMDLAEGHVKALEFLISNNSQFLNLNLGTGKGTSVLELVKTFERVNEVKISYTFASRRDGDAAIVVADNSLAKSIIGWSPSRTLENMCQDGWKWQTLNPKGYIDI